VPNRYATIDQVKREVDMDGGSTTMTTATYQYLWQALESVSARIERETALEFAPRVETRYFDARGDHLLRASLLDLIAGQIIDVKSPLLGITSVTLGGDSAALATSAYREYPRGVTPIQMLELIDGDIWTQYDTTYRNAHAIAGLWGYRTRYATDAWKLVDSLTSAVANTSVETVNVSSTSAVTGYGLPRFSPGMLIRIGTTTTTELRYIHTINSTTQFSASRAENGTTAQTPAQDTGVWVFQPESAIQRAALRWVAYLQHRRAKFGNVTYDGLTTESFPSDMPQEVRNILEEGGFLQRGMAWRAI
jgi:hypothetical protein